MAAVLQAIESHLREIANGCIHFKVDYDRLQSSFKNSYEEAKCWTIAEKLVESLQALLKHKSNKSSSKQEEDVKNEYSDCQTLSDSSFVQITASKSEIERRIESFLRKKQLDVDLHNQREFCNLLKTENEFSCARVDAVFLPRVGQKSHITVTDANHEDDIMKSDNVTVDTMLYSLPSKRQKSSKLVDELPYCIEERLENMESHLQLTATSVHRDVYTRIKKLEEKILYLEGLSPEYFTMTAQEQIPSRRPQTSGNRRKLISWTNDYNDVDIDEQMSKLKEKLLSESYVTS